MGKITKGYKLLRLRKDGTLGPLFINARMRVPVGVWLEAEEHPTEGFAFRPGWHATAKKSAPHLSKRGRVWCRVSLKGAKEYDRPASQGEKWLLAKWLRIDSVLEE